MKNALKNIVLIVALAAVIVIIIAILLYDFIPSGSTVAEPNIYTADASTTKILSEIAEESSSLNDQQNNAGSSTEPNIVLKSYSITETDLALYTASNEYEPGKADPFADAETSSNPDDGSGNSGNTATGGNTNNSTSGGSSNSGSTVSDGTLFNSTSSK